MEDVEGDSDADAVETEGAESPDEENESVVDSEDDAEGRDGFDAES